MTDGTVLGLLVGGLLEQSTSCAIGRRTDGWWTMGLEHKQEYLDRASMTVGWRTSGTALTGLFGGGLAGQSTSMTVGWQTNGTEY